MSKLIIPIETDRMSFIYAESVDHVDKPLEPAWVRTESAEAYRMATPAKTNQVAPPPANMRAGLETPADRFHGLGLIGGNTSALMRGNPQDIESELRGLTRPVSKVNERKYVPSPDKSHIAIHNNKYNMSIDTRTQATKEYQMWAYPATYAPQPLVKETCGAPHRF